MADPEIRYSEGKGGSSKVRFEIVGGNGEVQMKSELYDKQGNAERGAAELARSVVYLVEHGKIDPERAT